MPQPIDDVPFEIWGRIFEFSLRHAKRPDIRLSPTEAPISVSQTCTKWRQIALDIPSLWASITFSATREIGVYPHPSLVNLWLERSRMSPLFIDICTIDWRETLSSDVFECLSKIFLHIGRWKTAKLTVYSWRKSSTGVLSKLQSSAQGKAAPFLEVLELDIKPHAAHDEPLLPTNLWTDAPRLRWLMLELEVDMAENPNLSELDHIRMVISSNIPYPQITHLYLDLFDPVMVRGLSNVFQYTPNLVSCFIGGVCIARYLPHEAPAVTLRHLKYLGLRCLGNRAREIVYKEILNRITAPSLQTFGFFEMSSSQMEMDAFTNFISRSSCHLEELVVVGSFIESPNILQSILPPSLKILHVEFKVGSGTAFSPLLVHSLTLWDVSSGQFTLCPRLQQLSLSNIYIHSSIRNMDCEDRVKLLIQLCKTRLCPPGSSPNTFTEFVMHSHLFDPDHTDTRLLELCDEHPCLNFYDDVYIPSPRDLWNK